MTTLELDYEKLLAAARLTNAAPELLNAARAVIDEWDKMREMIQALKDAVDQARGNNA